MFRASIMGAVVCVAIAIPLLSQVRISTKASEKKAPELRAVGVLEWVGEPGKPSASRLVPIAIFTGERYQDAGVYLARPEPLAVERDTEYELQQAGTPRGRFDVFSAGNVEGFWYGYGVWKPLVEVHVPKLAVSKVLPQIQSNSDSDRPHFGHDRSDPQDTAANPPASAKSPGGSAPVPSADNGPHISSSSDDPDRPKLRKRQTSESRADASADATGASPESDPDRPKLHRGKTDSVSAEEKLIGNPLKTQQMVALSTTTADDPHSYVYQWANPEDATKMQSALEKVALEMLSLKHGAANILPPHKGTPTRTPKSTKAPPPVGLVTDDFRTFELSYSGGATMVFSCRTLDDGVATKFVTIIAQPDFYGVPRVLFKQVTDGGHLDQTPRMKLIDAMDTNGDHRAELIFELRGKGDRQFGIYQIGSGRAEQVFLTSSLP